MTGSPDVWPDPWNGGGTFLIRSLNASLFSWGEKKQTLNANMKTPSCELWVPPEFNLLPTTVAESVAANCREPGEQLNIQLFRGLGVELSSGFEGRHLCPPTPTPIRPIRGREAHCSLLSRWPSTAPLKSSPKLRLRVSSHRRHAAPTELRILMVQEAAAGLGFFKIMRCRADSLDHPPPPRPMIVRFDVGVCTLALMSQVTSPAAC